MYSILWKTFLCIIKNVTPSIIVSCVTFLSAISVASFSIYTHAIGSTCSIKSFGNWTECRCIKITIRSKIWIADLSILRITIWCVFWRINILIQINCFLIICQIPSFIQIKTIISILCNTLIILISDCVAPCVVISSIITKSTIIYKAILLIITYTLSNIYKIYVVTCCTQITIIIITIWTIICETVDSICWITIRSNLICILPKIINNGLAIESSIPSLHEIETIYSILCLTTLRVVC